MPLPWAAERLGLDVARVEGLVRAGELLAVPGPWPMRQAQRSDLGSFVPGWQFDGRDLYPALPALLQAAGTAGWTSLELHLFMTTPPRGGGETPELLLQRGDGERVLALIGQPPG